MLQEVAGLPEDEIIAALEEAQERAVIEERSTVSGALAFRFTHAFFRQTLYEEISLPAIRWHQQVARALEAVHARRLEDHAAELAEHFAHSSDAADLKKAVNYGELAAQRAMGVYAYGEAERHWARALSAQEVLDPDDAAKRVDLLLALGEAILPRRTGRATAAASRRLRWQRRTMTPSVLGRRRCARWTRTSAPVRSESYDDADFRRWARARRPSCPGRYDGAGLRRHLLRVVADQYWPASRRPCLPETRDGSCAGA